MKTKLVSILLPSLREANARKCINKFHELFPDIDYELILVSPFEIEGENVVNVHEVEPDGVIKAMDIAYKKSSGQFVVTWSDDAIPLPESLNLIIESCSKCEAGLAGFSLSDQYGSSLSQWQVFGKLYVGWFCAKREFLDSLGVMFDTSYKNFWADPDLALRVYQAKGEIWICEAAKIHVFQEEDSIKAQNLSASFDIDRVFFEKRWGELYKIGNKEWWEYNNVLPVTFCDHIRQYLRSIRVLRRLVFWLRSNVVNKK